MQHHYMLKKKACYAFILKHNIHCMHHEEFRHAFILSMVIRYLVDKIIPYLARISKIEACCHE